MCVCVCNSSCVLQLSLLLFQYVLTYTPVVQALVEGLQRGPVIRGCCHRVRVMMSALHEAAAVASTWNDF